MLYYNSCDFPTFNSIIQVRVGRSGATIFFLANFQQHQQYNASLVQFVFCICMYKLPPREPTDSIAHGISLITGLPVLLVSIILFIDTRQPTGV